MSKLQQYLAHYRKSKTSMCGDSATAIDRISIAEFYDRAALAAKVNQALPPYMNFGYWRDETTSIGQACDDLMSMLIEEMRRRSELERHTNRVLDVACGLGATTAYLSRGLPNASVFGINTTARQIEHCRQVATTCQFQIMDATQLSFEEEHFDYVTCVEAAFQFRTRERFLREAYRVLAKGGALAITDVLVKPETHAFDHMFSEHHPLENQLPSVDAYRELVRRCGFSGCWVIDITEHGANRFFRFQTASLNALWQESRISFSSLQRHLAELWLQDAILETLLICIAVK